MKRCPGNAGFSLVEVAFALGVAGFCLITIVALIPAGVNANKSSVEQTAATGLMAAVVADLRSAPTPTSGANGSFISPRYQIPMPRASDAVTTAPGYTLFLQEDGSLSGTLNANADPTQNPRYRVLLNFYPPGSTYYSSLQAGSPGTTTSVPTSSLAATRVRILITWPALSDPLKASAPTKYSGSVETVINLNRNWLDHN